ncbi:MAG TPA: ABC transporter substrate-binding protein [Candidatus Paenibacillus intestinavium]|nr:ABC transporter substrate-binding protein [Candidatus Paenibacillus intestinavium]
MTVTDFNDRTITINGVPDKVAALSIGETNIIYSLEGTLVGRPTTDVPLQWESSYDVREIGTTHEVDLEQIAYVKPQVILAHNIMNAKDVAKLENIGAKVVLTSGNSVADIQRQITIFGALLQKQSKAEQLVTEIDSKLTELAAESKAPVPALIVYGAPGTFMAALPSSLAGDILSLSGGTNIAADYPQLASYPQYATLDMERIVESNPQAIFIMTHADPEEVKDSFIREMEASKAWNSIDAVKNGHIEVLPAELFGSNPGTRINESLDYMYKVLHP